MNLAAPLCRKMCWFIIRELGVGDGVGVVTKYIPGARVLPFAHYLHCVTMFKALIMAQTVDFSVARGVEWECSKCT